MSFSYSAVLGLASREKVEMHLVERLNAWSEKWLDKTLDDCSTTFNETLFGSIPLETPDFESVYVAAKGEALCASLFCIATAYKGVLSADDEAFASAFGCHIFKDLEVMLMPVSADKSVNTQWGLTIDIKVAQVEFTLFVSATLILGILKSKPHTFEQSLTSSISHLTFEADIVLSKSQLNLAQLVTLRPGDVLPLSPSVKDAVNLKVNDQFMPKVGYLVSKHNHKSVILLSE